MVLRHAKNETAGRAALFQGFMTRQGTKSSLSTVYNYDPLLWFSIEGRGIYGRSEFENNIIINEFKKGIPLKYEFEKAGQWDTKYGGNKIYYDGNELFLYGGEYEYSANILYFLDEDNRPGRGHIVSASVTVNVQEFPIESIIAFIAVCLIYILFSKLSRANFVAKQIRSMRSVNKYEPTAYHDPAF